MENATLSFYLHILLERESFASKDPMESEDQLSDNPDQSEPPSTDNNEAPPS